MRAVTATRKLQTAAPLGVKVTSGSSVRLPVMVTWVSGMGVPSSGLVVLLNGLAAVVVRSVGCLLPGLMGSAGAGGGGGPWVVRHGPRLLPAGRARLLARPGRPGAPGRVGGGGGKGRRGG